MGWFHAQEEEEGISIEGRGCCIDITILEISKDYRKVKLQIDGIEGLNTLELSADDGLVTLVDDIKIGVRHKRYLNKDEISMHYDAPSDYQFDCKEY